MIDAIAEAEGISVDSKQFKAKVGKGNHMQCLLITVYITDTMPLSFQLPHIARPFYFPLL